MDGNQTGGFRLVTIKAARLHNVIRETIASHWGSNQIRAANQKNDTGGHIGWGARYPNAPLHRNRT
jgi:hypothetical protein